MWEINRKIQEEIDENESKLKICTDEVQNNQILLCGHLAKIKEYEEEISSYEIKRKAFDNLSVKEAKKFKNDLEIKYIEKISSDLENKREKRNKLMEIIKSYQTQIDCCNFKLKILKSTPIDLFWNLLDTNSFIYDEIFISFY